MTLRLLLIFPCLCLFSKLTAQSHFAQYDSLVNSFQSQEYSKAIDYGTDLREELEDIEMQNDTLYVNTLYYLENAHFYAGDYQNAVEIGKEEVAWCKEVYGVSDPFYQQSAYLLAILATYTADYEVSTQNFEIVLELMRYNGTHQTEDFITISNQLAGIYDLAGSYANAKRIYEESYQLASQKYSLEDSIMQVWTNAISSFYLTHGMYAEAEPFFLQSLDLMEQYYGKESEMYITVLNSLGEFYLYAGWYDQCANTFIDFVGLCKKYYGPKSADYATALNNLAVANEKLEAYEKAEKYYLECLALKEKVYKKESDYYALTLTNIAVLYDNMGDRTQAEKYFAEAVTIYKSIYGENSENYAIAINGLASVYSGAGKLEEAEVLLMIALDIQKELLGDKSPAYITSLNNLGQIHYEMGDYESAEREMQHVCDLRLSAQGMDHPDYANSLMTLANIKITLGKYIEAEDILFKSLSLIESTQGNMNESFCNGLSTLAGVYLETGRYDNAEDAFEESIRISENTRGVLHPEHATILNNMAQMYLALGRYDLAERFGLEAVNITIGAYGAEDPSLTYPYTVLANIYKNKEDLKTAEEYVIMAKNLAEKYYGLDHPNYLNALHNLAVFYYEIGVYEKAEPLYQHVSEKYKSIYGEQHHEYINVLNSLGALYMSKMIQSKDRVAFKQYRDDASSYYQQILQIDTLNKDLKSQNFALHLNNAGELYRLSGDYDQAETLLLASIDKVTKLLGADHLSLGVNYNNLGLLYDNMGNAEKAIVYYEKSIDIKEKYYGKNSSSLANSYVNLASLKGGQGAYDEAYELFNKGFEIDANNIALNFSFLSTEEQSAYLENSKYYIDLLNTFGSNVGNAFPEVAGLMYDNELRKKGLILKSGNKVKQFVMNSKDDQLLKLYNDWMTSKKTLASQLSMPVESRTIKAEELEVEISNIEKELNKSVGIQEELNENSWKVIQKKLNDNQAAIEFNFFYKQGESVTPVYGALILTKEMLTPVYVELCSQEELLEIIGMYGANNLSYVNQVYGKQNALNVSLYELIWKPMEEELSDVNEVFYSPAGHLHKVSFSAIGISENTYLSDRFILHQLNTTASFVNKEEQLMTKEAVLFGGAQYSKSKSDSDIWSYLPGTKDEVLEIAKTLDRGGVNTSTNIAGDATEEAFKALDQNAPSLLHIATHGFFYPDLADFESDELAIEDVDEIGFRGAIRGYDVFVKSKNPLMRSGIVLSGANDVWKGENTSELKGEDGVLTSYEVSNLDLSSVELMVLSACETGLGEIKGSEGVYGLQRAFKSAGVKYLVMSLWQVPDKETKEFMNEFYAYLLDVKNPQEAFRLTQNKTKATFDPYYWGAFVLIQ